MRIALVFNVRHTGPSLSNKQAMEEAEFDTKETIQGITAALKKCGHKVILIEADENAYLKLKKLKSKIDLVFNIAEGLHGADRECQLPAMLEMLELPYVGSKPLTQAVCLSKARTKEILKYYGVPTPDFQLFKTGREKMKNLKFPLIVKPNFEGSSKGIFNDCFVENKNELKKKVKQIISKFKQPALAEEFLPGREFTIGLIGNDPVEILPLVEIDFSAYPKNLHPMESYEAKWIVDNPDSKVKTVICPAKTDSKLSKRIKETCRNAKEALGILDWCRMDLRLDKKGVPNILEVNQIPGIIPDPKENSRLPLAARAKGYQFYELLGKIIKSAQLRYKKTC